MTQNDLLYRALKEYRKLTLSGREAAQKREAIVRADADKDRLTVTRMICTVEEDWVNAIEEGLVFIGKCIEEDRQFILSNGETMEIEKVKHVSKESVEHLARHSNYITRVQEGEDIIPDRLYTVERLNDYAVYENRFLYMVLSNLRDFVALRYNRISELANTYHGEFSLNKTVRMGKESLVYCVQMEEERREDKYLLTHNPIRPMLDRLDAIMRAVYHYLRTPLMLEVSKADKLKPPITKTNVLRMDKNFKEVVKLYEFLMAYTKDGYTVNREEREFAPFSSAVADEFSETVVLSSFLAYEHGLGMEEELEEEYQKEEQRRREEEEARKLERIKELRKRIAEQGGTPEEYMLLLEQRNDALEADSIELQKRRKEIEVLNGEIGKLNEELAAHRGEIAELNERHGRELAELGTRIDQMNREREEEREAHRIALREAEDEYFRDITARDEAHRAAMAEKEKEVEESTRRTAEAEDRRALSEGRLNALRFEQGLTAPQDDFTSEEGFGELEHQYAVFQVLFRGQWKKARRRIRREVWKATVASILAQRKKKEEAKKAEAGEAPQTEGEVPQTEGEEAPQKESEEAPAEQPQRGDAPEPQERAAAQAEQGEDGESQQGDPLEERREIDHEEE